MKRIAFICLLSVLLLSSCTFTFGGTLFMITIRDLLLYIFVAFVLALIIAAMRAREKRLTGFWIAFVISLLLTPLAGFIYLLIIVSRRMNARENKNTDDVPPRGKV